MEGGEEVPSQRGSSFQPWPLTGSPESQKVLLREVSQSWGRRSLPAGPEFPVSAMHPPSALRFVHRGSSDSFDASNADAELALT